VRVLLTGANGFIGSHILQELVRDGFEAAVLLRTTSDTRFIEGELSRVRVHYGELMSRASLREAVQDAEVLIHCAGKTRALRPSDYYAVNDVGTRNLVAACNRHGRALKQLVVVSSLAASGPGTLGSPATEQGRPRPVSAYGRSKLLGERRVRARCRVPYTILRPAAVYGPRDRDFHLAFQTVRRGVAPLVNGGRQRFSLVYVGDVVQGVMSVLGRPEAYGKTYHLAHPRPWSQREFLLLAARMMHIRPVSFFLPQVALYPVYLGQELVARLTCRPSIMNLQRLPEYGVPGWVCSTERAARELGFVAATPLPIGLRRTLDWYMQKGWLRAA